MSAEGGMSEERKVKVMQHVHKLEKVMRFWYPDSGAGRTVSQEHLLGVLAEMLTRIDELREEKKDLEDRMLRCEERIADLVRDGISLDKRVGELDQRTLTIQPFGAVEK